MHHVAVHACRSGLAFLLSSNEFISRNGERYNTLLTFGSVLNAPLLTVSCVGAAGAGARFTSHKVIVSPSSPSVVIFVHDRS
jgi:hypothetical protein